MSKSIFSRNKLLFHSSNFYLILLLIFSDTNNISKRLIFPSVPYQFNKGLEAKNNCHFVIAKKYFQNSIHSSPNFLPAYIELVSIESDSVSLWKTESLFSTLTKKNPKDPGPIFGSALIFIKKWQLDQAIIILNKCHPSPLYQNLVQLKIAEAQRCLGYFKESNKQLKKILRTNLVEYELHLKAHSLDLMGENWYDLGDLAHAENLHQTALEIATQIGDARRHGSALINLARVHYRFENFQKADTCLQSAISLARASGDSLVLADALRNLGVIYWLRGFFQRALTDGYEPALEIYRSLNHRYSEAITLSDIGLLYYQQQDYHSHFQYQRQALNIQNEIGDRRGQADTYYFIANAWYRVGEGSKALKLFHHAYQIAKEIDYYWIQEAVSKQDYKPLGHKIAVDFEQRSSEIYGYESIPELRVKAWMACRNFRYEESLAIMRYLLPLEQLQHNLKNIANCHSVMGECYLSLGKLDSAQIHFEIGKAITDSIGLSNFAICYGLGNVAEQSQEWSKALNSYREALRSHQQISAKAEDLDFQAIWSGRIAESHLAIIRMLIRQGQESHDKTWYYSQAFQIWQAATARQFNSLMAKHFDFKNQRNISRISDIQNSLPANTCLLGYLVDEKQTFVFVISANDFDVLEVPITRSNLESKLELSRALLEQVNYSNDSMMPPLWREVLKSLYEALIFPAQKAGYLYQIEQLLIVPTRVLHFLPFACLIGTDSSRNSNTSQTSFYLAPEQFYLIEKYTITYLASAEMTKYPGLSESKPLTFGQKPWLIVTPFPDQIQGTNRETNAIQSDSIHSIHCLFGVEAQEGLLKEKASNYNLIHFTSHSHLAIDLPESTYVVLRSDNREDGRLTIPEILNLKLESDLIVLSSCESGLGASRFYNPVAVNNYHPLDEFISLNRAFLIGGAKKAISTFWTVQDEASAEFMHKFYHYLTASSPEVSLVKTQRYFISQKSSSNVPLTTLLAHPYIWGAYLMVGM